MATRSSIRFATREEGVSFNKLPEKINAKFYAHWDGYPSHRGVEIAESILNSTKLEGWEIDYLDTRRSDLEYVYYVWQAPLKTTWISIFKCNPLELAPDPDQDECIFVGTPVKLINKYKPNTNDER